MITDANN